jgi:hypothetical protein
MIEERRYSTSISMSFVRTSLAAAGYCQVHRRLCQRTRGSWELENVRVRRDKSLVNFSPTICFCAHALHNVRLLTCNAAMMARDTGYKELVWPRSFWCSGLYVLINKKKTRIMIFLLNTYYRALEIMKKIIHVENK